MGNLRCHKGEKEQIKIPNPSTPSTPSYSDNAKSICEININTKLVSKFLKGFLLKFFMEQETFYCDIYRCRNRTRGHICI